mgnify:CR=1 FL=1|tara:strand:+ start:14068 stop:14523 length:456 start_codon:yes stop_codon:yes gene_type:complete
MADGRTPECLGVKRITPNAKLPTRGSVEAAGYDLYASNDTPIPITRQSGRAIIPTGIQISLPSGTYGRVAPRSGLAVKSGLSVGAGVIDRDYTGEVMVLIFNHGDEDFVVPPGMRIAQLVIERITTPEIVELDSIGGTSRGDDGFGSTGLS